MAMIGMRHVVFAKIDEETAGEPIEYEALQNPLKAISANLTWERSDNPLYADDTVAEDDNGITGGTLEISVDDLSGTARPLLLGETLTGYNMDTGIADTTTGDGAAPCVGIGFLRVRRKAGVTSFEGNWFHKVQFSMTSESAQTKGQSVEWQTPTVTGRIYGVRIDEDMNVVYRRRMSFDNEADAIAWLENYGNEPEEEDDT